MPQHNEVGTPEEGTSMLSMLAAARAGDDSAWNGLVDEYSSLLWSIARSYRLDAADAHDAVQMTWLRLVENLDRIRDDTRLAGWLATTVRRECLSILRRSARVRPASDSAILDVADSSTLDERVLLDERDAALWSAFTRLGEACQRLLRVMMATPPPTYQDVSAALDIAVGTIGPARQRCLARLRRIVGEDEALAGVLEGGPS